MELILSYFPELDVEKKHQLSALGDLYKEWNAKINVISRKDIDHLYEHHVLHSLVLAKYNPFQDGMKVLDVGTGGGFPGIPLAIMYPDIHFTLLDSVAKKIQVVREVVATLSLKNVQTIHARMESHKGEYKLIIGRAVSTLTQTIAWSKHLTREKRWVMLKGGDRHEIRKELLPIYKMTFTPVSDYFKEEYFKGKFIVDVRKD